MLNVPTMFTILGNFAFQPEIQALLIANDIQAKIIPLFEPYQILSAQFYEGLIFCLMKLTDNGSLESHYFLTKDTEILIAHMIKVPSERGLNDLYHMIKSILKVKKEYTLILKHHLEFMLKAFAYPSCLMRLV